MNNAILQYNDINTLQLFCGTLSRGFFGSVYLQILQMGREKEFRRGETRRGVYGERARETSVLEVASSLHSALWNGYPNNAQELYQFCLSVHVQRTN